MKRQCFINVVYRDDTFLPRWAVTCPAFPDYTMNFPVLDRETDDLDRLVRIFLDRAGLP